MAEARLDARDCRVQILGMLTHAGSGYPGARSVTDFLVSIVSGGCATIRSGRLENRDRIVLPKGHAVRALYTVLAKAGCFSEAQLVTLRNAQLDPCCRTPF